MTAHSQRAIEESEDLIAQIERRLAEIGLHNSDACFRLEGDHRLLSRDDAIQWMRDSVDEGYANLGFHIESSPPARLIVNLAAYEDPDSQFHP